ncbi:hypothetical protein EYA84_02040 [Verrucosispora sp. SN26_14.1]|uniref:hypothetical protein n=1 Tax=Verrucosispora sp. SN26_14.1 TaxID=2527879 RepID=UPI001033E798|nr:hypothetical protein [Verrucosispora sp. SN26_14.1]TBL44246.1 hypothetical protein EYA84_02040 [Verrucosispora sp. SN26_14.1]
MATLTNSFEGGTAGDTITTGNSGGSSGDAWTLTGDTAGGSCTYSATGPSHGSRCMAVTLGATGGAVRRGWSVNAEDSTNTQHFRFYIDPGSVSGTVSPLRAMNVTSSAQRFRVQLTAAGVLTFHNNGNATLWTSSALAAGTQWRVEVSAAGSTSATARVRIFAGDATSASQDSGDLTGVNMGGPLREVWFGQTGATSNVSLRLDEVGWSDTAPLGPATSPTVSGILAGSLPPLSASAAGSARSSGAAVVLLPGLSAALAGAARASGAASVSLPAVSVALVGGASSAGVLAAGLPSVSASMVGSARAAGLVVVSLPALAVSAAGGVRAPGVLAAVLPSLAVALVGGSESAGGIVPRPVEGVVVRPAGGVVVRPAAGVVTRP